MGLILRPMEIDDIPEVMKIERISFPSTWSPSFYRREILENDKAFYFVIEEKEKASEEQFSDLKGLKKKFLNFLGIRKRREGAIIGFAGFWFVRGEIHITTVAVRPEYRGRKFGELLVSTIVDFALNKGADLISLEVRISNIRAQRLYEKYGFVKTGIRPHYYESGEDAYIMCLEGLRSPSFREKFEKLKSELKERFKGIEMKGLI